MNDDAASLLFQSDALRRVGGRPMRPPLLATRDALRSVLARHRVVGIIGAGVYLTTGSLS